jgi:hypothetical protein
VVADPQQVAQLVHAGQDGHFLGHDLIEAAPREETREVGLDRAPVLADVEEHVGFVGPEVGRDLTRRRADGHVEGVGEAMGDVGRDDQRLEPALGAQNRRRRGDAGLAHSPFAGVEQDPSQLFSPPQLPLLSAKRTGRRTLLRPARRLLPNC